MKQSKWHLPAPQVDYRKVRLSNLRQPEYRHLLLLLFWPVYWLRYPIVEAINPVERCYLMHCALDEQIPFLEGFIVPYSLWMPIMLGINLFMLFYDVEAFKKYTRFLIVSFSISTITFLVFPTYQDLRPEQFPRQNVFTKVVEFIYAADTCTNVCPSEHVMGSIAFLIAAVHSKTMNKPWCVAVVAVLAFLTGISTVFLKQHSFIDVAAAVPVCLIAYWVCYGKLSIKENHPAEAPSAE